MLDHEFAACSRLLDELAGAPVQIIETQGMGSEWAPVERLVLAADYPRIGRSIVVKTRRHDEAGWGGHRSNLIAEYRALALLAESGLNVAPKMLAFDEAAGVLVMKDLGPGPSVEQVLFDSGPNQAAAALVGLAAAAGRVHAATRTIENAIWNESGQFIQGVDQPWERLSAEAARLAFPDPRAAASDVATLSAALQEPRWRTLTHGDLTPNNALVGDGPVRLVDFEAAGPRHALLDGAGFRLSFPQYGRWAALPEAVMRAMDDAYRTELARGLPLAADDLAYGQAMATGCAAWALVRLSRLGVIAAEDQAPDVKLRRRSQIVHTVESCVATVTQSGSYPALMAWFAAVTAEMRQRWPEANAEPRRFPAFNSEPAADD